MAHGHGHSAVHVSSIKSFATVFITLVALTWITYFAALVDFGLLNTPIAILIAMIKTTLVILYFMHLKFGTKLMMLSAVSGFFFLVIMFVFTYADYLSRPTPLGW